MYRVISRWFDADPGRLAGTTPDYRFSLANERTFLSWLRTGLALVGGGLAAAQFLPPGRLRIVVAVVLLALGAAVAVRSIDRFTRSERAMRVGADLPPSRFPALLALAVTVGAVTILFSVLAS